MWLSSPCLLACVLGNVSALCILVLAALILCLMLWCELKLKSRYLSVCVGLLSTSISRLLPCRVISVSKREILLSSSSSITVFLIMEKLSSNIKRFHVFGFVCVVSIAVFSMTSMHTLATTGLTGLPITQP